jgi:hypothetical protein
MNVVHLSDSLMSAAPYRLAQIQRAHGLNARVINGETCTNGGPRQRAYPLDLLNADPEPVLRPVLEAADVVHYHHRWRDSELFAAHPWAWDVVKDKPSLVQFHVPRTPRIEAILRESTMTSLVVAQYHVRMYPESIPVQNAVPIDDEYHRPLGVRNDPPVVAFTPPDCQAGGWWDKGCRPTMEVLSRGFRHRVVTDCSWREAMLARQVCDVAIDEVVTGSYHMCSLESLSQGLATVAGLDARTVDALEQVTGTREHPWVVATPETLHRKLTELVSDPDYLQAKRDESRAYMVRHWDPAALVARFRAIYEGVADRHGSGDRMTNEVMANG